MAEATGGAAEGLVAALPVMTADASAGGILGGINVTVRPLENASSGGHGGGAADPSRVVAPARNELARTTAQVEESG